MGNVKHWLKVITAAALLSGMATSANAHTIAVSIFNAGAPGSVTIWLGSYHTTNVNEGSISVGTGPATAFNLFSSTTPAGAVLGTNVFFSSCTSYQGCPGDTGLFNNLTNNTGQSINRWQGITLTGLSAGTQSYTISGMSTVNWQDWNTGSTNWTGQLTISNAAAGVPEPLTLALMGLGLAALGGSKRRKQLS